VTQMMDLLLLAHDIQEEILFLPRTAYSAAYQRPRLAQAASDVGGTRNGLKSTGWIDANCRYGLRVAGWDRGPAT